MSEQRPIKFRAWHKKHGMIYPDEHFTLQDAIIGNLDFFGSPAKDFNIADFVFMQYIGLQDANGEDIYEGDIVTSNHPDIVDGYRWVVQWKDAGFYPFNDVDEQGHGELRYGVRNQLETFEVIGNIHEHPELLEGKA
jgi:uncharacterized phage protein (TIGR01671 family)